MAKCKDCVICGVCFYNDQGDEAEKCDYFKSKDAFVEVVRCKDCTEWIEQDQECYCWHGFKENDFCSHGIRKQNKTCDTCRCNKVCDHNNFGFEDCGNYIPEEE